MEEVASVPGLVDRVRGARTVDPWWKTQPRTSSNQWVHTLCREVNVGWSNEIKKKKSVLKIQLNNEMFFHVYRK